MIIEVCIDPPQSAAAAGSGPPQSAAAGDSDPSAANSAPPRSALQNMRQDEADFAAAEDYPQARLRFYSWSRPAITCGYAQRPDKLIDTARATALGVELASRITGGGMVFHQPGELTYCLIAPLGALPEGILPSCNFISGILLRGLHKLGIPAALAARAGDTGRQRDICFLRPAKYELTVHGKKLIGSAQKRGRRALLQHGSLPLEPPLPVFAEFTDLAALNRSATNIQECTDTPCTYQRLAELLAAEFQEEFSRVKCLAG